MMPTVESPFGSLYYAAVRRAESPYPPLVLVHGAGGSHLDWPAELRRLPDATVIALDLPGHGRSSGDACTNLSDYLPALAALLEARTIERAIIVGHSMGGAVAQLFALAHPEQTAGLVLIGTGSKLPVDPTLPARVVEAPDATIDWLTEWAWGPGAPADLREMGRARMLAAGPDALRADYLACQGFDVRGQLDRIGAPALVIGASEDRMVPPNFARTLAEQIPRARLVMIDGAGHMIPQERPDEVAGAVAEWLAGQTWAD